MPGRKNTYFHPPWDNQSLWLIRCVKVKKVCLQRQSLKFAGSLTDLYHRYPLVTDKEKKKRKNQNNFIAGKLDKYQAVPLKQIIAIFAGR